MKLLGGNNVSHTVLHEYGSPESIKLTNKGRLVSNSRILVASTNIKRNRHAILNNKNVSGNRKERP